MAGKLPVTSSDKAMSLRHHRETATFARKKAREHLAAAKSAAPASKAYHLEHGKGHLDEAKSREKAAKKVAKMKVKVAKKKAK